MEKNQMEVHQKSAEPWKVTLVDTGQETMTGGRLRRVRDYIGTDTFCMTYGDGVSNINIRKLIEFHISQGTKATITAVQPPERFGVLNIVDSKVAEFQEKPAGQKAAWVSGGFFVMEPAVLDLIENDSTIFEKYPLEQLAKSGELSVFKHSGFWQPMDTLRDKNYLERLWDSHQAPWKLWD
jgi:glucose-1-phosphate cytidylyltransferase